MAVVAIGGDDLIALADIGLHADDDGFLADIEMAEAADQPHAVELARLLLEAADQQHVAIEFGGERRIDWRRARRRRCVWPAWASAMSDCSWFWRSRG